QLLAARVLAEADARARRVVATDTALGPEHHGRVDRDRNAIVLLERSRLLVSLLEVGFHRGVDEVHRNDFSRRLAHDAVRGAALASGHGGSLRMLGPLRADQLVGASRSPKPFDWSGDP